ncbi:Potassium transporter [Microbotryomycetes sp. JL201]|nr:Potassium transporter [Microbotryomycetes sp. JL201]
MCCSNAAWKREVVPDHKVSSQSIFDGDDAVLFGGQELRADFIVSTFDFINVHEFHSKALWTRLQYLWLWILFAKSIAVYIADIYTAVALLASNRWSATYLQAADDDGSSHSTLLQVPFKVGKWVFTGCIIFSFLLLLWEARKARAIIKSRDISYAFTNVMSQNWYSLRSYDHFCFFCQIDNSKKKKDEFAFFIFFTFKGWKRLLLADAPRQVINAITLYSFGKSENWTTDLSVYFSGPFFKSAIIVTMLFTVIMWAGSALLLLVAAAMYVPLLCYIQGNLKEYCCHKVDKRIAELMKRKTRKRLAKEAEIARKEAKGDFSHLMDKKTGRMKGAPLPQPTLPQIGLHEDRYELYSNYNESDVGSVRGLGVGAPPSRFQYPPQAPYSTSIHHASSLSRPTFPYQPSDPDFTSLSHGLNDSVTSLDGFACRGAPMGFDPAYAGVPLGVGAASLPMERAPSYKTEPDTSLENEKCFGRPPPKSVRSGKEADEDSEEDAELDDTSAYVLPRQPSAKRPKQIRQAHQPLPQQQQQQQQQQRSQQPPAVLMPQARSATQQYPSMNGGEYLRGARQDQLERSASASSLSAPVYQPPSRQQLYDRALRQAKSTGQSMESLKSGDEGDDGYAHSSIGVSGSLYGGHGGGGGGTWEESSGRAWLDAEQDRMQRQLVQHQQQQQQQQRLGDWQQQQERGGRAQQRDRPHTRVASAGENAFEFDDWVDPSRRPHHDARHGQQHHGGRDPFDYR